MGRIFIRFIPESEDLPEPKGRPLFMGIGNPAELSTQGESVEVSNLASASIPSKSGMVVEKQFENPGQISVTVNVPNEERAAYRLTIGNFHQLGGCTFAKYALRKVTKTTVQVTRLTRWFPPRLETVPKEKETNSWVVDNRDSISAGEIILHCGKRTKALFEHLKSGLLNKGVILSQDLLDELISPIYKQLEELHEKQNF